MKSTSMNICKYLVFFFNLIFFICGGVLLGLGIYALVSKNGFAAYLPPEMAIKNILAVMIFVGSVVFVAGFLGCCGAIKENKCMLLSFFIVVLIIFIIEIVGVILMYVYYPKVGSEIVKFINENPDDLDALQEKMKCCGFNGPSDYANGAPKSCRSKTTNEVYQEGCKDALTKYFWVIGGIGIFVLFIEIVAMISAIVLFKNVGEYETA